MAKYLAESAGIATAFGSGLTFLLWQDGRNNLAVDGGIGALAALGAFLFLAAMASHRGKA